MIGYIILGIVVYIVLTGIVAFVTINRRDDTRIVEVILICLFFTPIIGLIVEMLKPYRPKN